MPNIDDVLEGLAAAFRASSDFRDVREVHTNEGLILKSFPEIALLCEQVEYDSAEEYGDADYAHADVVVTLTTKPDPRVLTGAKGMRVWGERLRDFLTSKRLLIVNGVNLLEGSYVTTIQYTADLGQVDWIQAVSLIWGVDFLAPRTVAEGDEDGAPVTRVRVNVDDAATAIDPDDYVEFGDDA